MTHGSDGPAQRFMCDRKTNVLRAGQRHDQCFILLDGLLIREQMLDNGCRHIAGVYLPGDVCGLPSLINGTAEYDMVALSATSYVPVARHQLTYLAQKSTQIAQAVWQELSRECAISAAWIVNLGQRPAYQRLAHLFCELDARFRAAGKGTSAGFEWRGTQSDIGAATGLSLVHVNKTLRRLGADGLVASGRAMRCPDIAKLRVVAGFDPSYLALDREPLADLLLSRIGGVDAARSETAFGWSGDPLSMPTTTDRLRMAS